ncbi:MAG: hypothetical protein K940chlam3_00265 [Chlamydiae bacterium]|nr:hypothetical protein [Chlamydiota bacterium]
MLICMWLKKKILAKVGKKGKFNQFPLGKKPVKG